MQDGKTIGIFIDNRRDRDAKDNRYGKLIGAIKVIITGITI